MVYPPIIVFLLLTIITYLSAVQYKLKITSPIGYENDIFRAQTMEIISLRAQLDGKIKMLRYVRTSAANIETEFTSLRLTHQTLQDDYEEMEKTKDEFKEKAGLLREKVWRQVEEIDRLNGGVKKENALAEGRPSWRQKGNRNNKKPNSFNKKKKAKKNWT